jgi:excisionase family DNA binding protein
MKDRNIIIKEVMDIKELAHYLGIGKSKIYGLIRHKKIPASRIGRQYRFSKEVIDSWLKEKIITSEGEESQLGLFRIRETSLVDQGEKTIQ